MLPEYLLRLFLVLSTRQECTIVHKAKVQRLAEMLRRFVRSCRAPVLLQEARKISTIRCRGHQSRQEVWTFRQCSSNNPVDPVASSGDKNPQDQPHVSSTVQYYDNCKSNGDDRRRRQHRAKAPVPTSWHHVQAFSQQRPFLAPCGSLVCSSHTGLAPHAPFSS